MSTPDVTVVVPTRNREATLRQTLDAVLGQLGVSTQLVVVDEGSSDNTPALLRSIGDERLEVLRHDEPRGLPAARNAGLRLARGPWTAFCDDDDVWAPDKLRRQLEALAATRAAKWVTAGSVLVDPDLDVIGHQRLASGDGLLDRLLTGNVVPGGGSGTMVHTDLVTELGGFDEELRASEDWDLWIRLAERAPAATVDEPLVGYRIWTGSMSTDDARMRTSYRILADRYRSLAARRGVRPDTAAYERFLARQRLHTGRRLPTAAAFGRVTAHSRHPADIGRAVAALVAPRALGSAGRSRARTRIPDGWQAQAERWLAPHREPGRTPATAATG